METTREERVAASNEWMRRFIEEPERFEREWQTVEGFKAEEASGAIPSYGERCEAYLELLIRQARQAEGRSTPAPPFPPQA